MSIMMMTRIIRRPLRRRILLSLLMLQISILCLTNNNLLCSAQQQQQQQQQHRSLAVQQEVSLSSEGEPNLYYNTRSIDPFVGNGKNSSSSDRRCKFTGDRKIVLGQAASMKDEDRFFFFGRSAMVTGHLMVDHINSQRCGVRLGDRNYALELRHYEDYSTVNGTEYVGTNVVSEEAGVDVIIGGYSSGLSLPLSKITNESQRLLLAPFAASTPVFQEMDLSFGMLPPTHRYLTGLADVARVGGARTVSTIVENAPALKQVCGSVRDLAADNDMEFVREHTFDPRDAADYDNVILPMMTALANEDNPHVVVVCAYECVELVRALRELDWTPGAQIFVPCFASADFHDALGADADYMMGSSAWATGVKTFDAVTEWNSTDFDTRFIAESHYRNTPYQAAAMAGAVSLAVQLMEATNSTDDTILAEYAATHTFATVFGDISFDENGQNQQDNLFLQRHGDGTIQTVFPESLGSANFVYPIPTWAYRDCLSKSPCEADPDHTGNACHETSGKCICGNDNLLSVGSHGTAACIQQESMNYIPSSMITVGYIMFGIIVVSSIAASIWLYQNRQSWIVKASQPGLLGMVIVGCFVSNLSMPFLGIETDYRSSTDDNLQDGGNYSVAFEGDTNPDIAFVDASCMASSWLYGIGFALALSALIAKIERVRLIVRNPNPTQRIKLIHVLYIVAIVLVVEIAILTAWQIVSPFQWERDVLAVEHGFAIESSGRCTSEHGNYFLLGLIVFHIVALLAALVLCYRTRNIDPDFAESKDIAMSIGFMFQVLVLVVPVAMLVDEKNDILYFVRICAVFLQNFMVLGLIFVPKICKNATLNSDKPEALETIPLSSLTNSKWDEGIDLLREFLQESSPVNQAMTPEQKAALKRIQKMLLTGDKGDRKSEIEKKMAYIPKLVLQKPSKANRFIMNEFGGVSRNIASSATIDVLNARGEDSVDMMDESRALEEKGSYAPPEFHDLSNDNKKAVRKLLTLTSLDSWEFDIFELVKFTNNPLLFMGWAILGSPHSQESMASHCKESMSSSQHSQEEDEGGEGYDFGLPMRTLCDFLRVIEADYQESNPYHNATHAADVLQSLHFLIQMMLQGSTDEENNAATRHRYKEELMAILLAAAVHDVCHPGLNNNFQVNGRTRLALQFNDGPVLEKMHISHAFTRMFDLPPSLDVSQANLKNEGKFNVLSWMSQKQFASVRNKMIEAVMQTDMSKHFQTVSTMKSVAIKLEEEGLNLLEDDESRWQALLYMLHMADISNQAKPKDIAFEWRDRVLEEFFAQGDKEKILGMTVSPLCDRKTVDVMDSQIGFINFVVMPSFTVLGQVLPGVNDRILPYTRKNLEFYESSKLEQPPATTAGLDA